MTASEIVKDMIHDFLTNIRKVQDKRKACMTELIHREGKGVCIFYVPSEDKAKVIELLTSMYGESSGERIENYTDPLTN